MAKFKFNFGSDTSTTLFHNANASGNDFNMYTTCHTSGEPVFGNIRVTGNSVFSNATFTSSDNTIIDICGNSGSNYYSMLRLCPSGTQNSYLRFGGDLFVQTVGGTDLFAICDNGNVGIGTASPANDFNIQKSKNDTVFGIVCNTLDDCNLACSIWLASANGANGGDAAFGAWVTGCANWTFGQDTSDGGKFKFSNNTSLGSDTFMTICTGGNVGIGTASPVTKLDVFSGSGTKPDDPFSGQNQLFLSSGSTANAGLTIAADDGTNDIVSFFQSNQSADVGLIGTQSNHALRIRTNNSDRITILGGGNVGIGTTTPAVKLDIDQDGNPSGSVDVLRIQNSDGAGFGEEHRIKWKIDTRDIAYIGASYLTDTNGGGLTFATRQGGTVTETMRLDENGNVGIGTDSPDQRLHVCSTSHTQFTVEAGADNNHYAMINVKPKGTCQGYLNFWGDKFFIAKEGQTARMTICCTGEVGIGVTDPSSRLHVACEMTLGPDDSNRGIIGYLPSEDRLYFGTRDSGTNYFDAVNVYQGQLGIGTCSPSHPLHVKKSSGNSIIASESGDNAGDLYLIGNRTSDNDTSNLTFYNSSEPIARIRAYRHGANDAGKLTFATQATGGNPVEHMTICPDGKVGIGTTSPQRQLHVHCSSSSWDQCASLRLSSENVTNFYGEVQFHRGTSDTSDMGLNLLVSNSGSENLTPKLHVNVNGNVGIGTVTPSGILHTKSDDLGVVLQTSATAHKRMQIFFQDRGGTQTGRFGNDISGGDSAQMQWVAGSGSTPQMTLTSDGYVSIGSTSSSYPLQVITNISGGTNPQIVARDLGTSDATVGFQIASAANWSIGIDNSDSDKFKIATGLDVGTTPRMTIDTSGYVGVGTADPDVQLEIYDSSTADGESANQISLSTAHGTNRSSTIYMGRCGFVTDTDPRYSVRIRATHSSSTHYGSCIHIQTHQHSSTANTWNNGIFMNQSGNVGIGNTSPEARLDIQSGNIALVMGADSGATSMTDATTKTARMGVHHYTNDEEPLAILVADSESTTGTLYIGGGTSTMNATSFIKFYTAADGTTTTGTERMSINNSGVVCSACCFLSPVVCGSSCVSSPKVFGTDFCFHTGYNGTFGTAQAMNASTSSSGVVQLGTNNVVDPHRDGDGSAGSGSMLFHMLQVGIYNNNKAGAQQATQVGYWNNICDTDTDNNENHSMLLQVGHTNTIKNNFYEAGTGNCGKYTKYGVAIGNCNSIDKTGYYCLSAGCFYYGSVAMGNCNCVQCESGIAVGGMNTSTGLFSAAMGNCNCACALNSLAIGLCSGATGSYSSALGYKATVSTEGHMALGVYNSADWVCTNGGICAVGDMVACTSDRRLKCNILTITCAIERLKNIRGVSFEWDRDYIKKEGIKFSPREKSTTYGFIAQELEESVPDAVLEAPFAEAINKKLTDKEKYKTIKPEKIIPFLVEASKEQQLTIEKQQQQINTLTCQVEMLLKRCA